MRDKKTFNCLLPVFKIIHFASLACIFLVACNNSHITVAEKEVVETPEDINAKAEELIQGTLKDILYNSHELSDSFRIRNAERVQFLYDRNSFQPLWSSKGVFNKNADSLFAFIERSRIYGLFPADYYYPRLLDLRTQLVTDTSRDKKLDASLWAYSDLMFTSAFVQIVSDLREGRLLPDSILQKDSVLSKDYFSEQLGIFQRVAPDSFARLLEPRITGYARLKQALGEFLPKADLREYTFVSTKDSLRIPKLLYKRLAEEDTTLKANDSPDSAQVSTAIKNYQKRKEQKVDGRISSALISRLNNTDREKFIRIAINFDRYKMMEDTLPDQYIWVNLPSFYLQLCEGDSVRLVSKIVVGKPTTRTPLITSAISDMITYPKWTIPESIVKKEILPGLQRDKGYTIRRGYSLVDAEGNEVDPYGVNWSKYKNSIPYKVVQGSGDANALGVLKFNFPNKYSVYLHDTNQRYLFSRTARALSHGCVRVQAWDSLARYILRNDSATSANAIPVDSMQSWLDTKQRRYIPVRKPIPLYIRYFTCDVNKEGDLVFYEDIYGEDKRIREKLFVNK
jgi:murein L,D-transpeptidase YcbB/YkuD